jgi:hypothetical protein
VNVGRVGLESAIMHSGQARTYSIWLHSIRLPGHSLCPAPAAHQRPLCTTAAYERRDSTLLPPNNSLHENACNAFLGQLRLRRQIDGVLKECPEAAVARAPAQKIARKDAYGTGQTSTLIGRARTHRRPEKRIAEPCGLHHSLAQCLQLIKQEFLNHPDTSRCERRGNGTEPRGCLLLQVPLGSGAAA